MNFLIPDLIYSGTFSTSPMELDQLIRQHKSDIIEQWIAEVRNQVPEARDLETLALQNDIPDLLDDIIASLDQNQGNRPEPKTVL